MSVSTPSAKLAELGLELPPAAVPSFDYVPATRYGDLVFVSGQLPKEDGEVRLTGTLGADVSIEQAQHAAKICTLQGLACAAEFVGGIDEITSVLRVTGFVASTPDFHDQPRVVDAASELVGAVFGRAGRHARSAVGVAALPRKSPVEIEFVLAAG